MMATLNDKSVSKSKLNIRWRKRFIGVSLCGWQATRLYCTGIWPVDLALEDKRRNLKNVVRIMFYDSFFTEV